MYRKIITSVLILGLTGVLALAMGKPPETLQQASDFTLEDIYGRKVSLADYKGKLIFLNFWATWCPPCRKEMPSMQKMYEDSDSKKFVMVAVSVREARKTVQDFVAKNGYAFPVLLDQTGMVARHYKVYSIPATFIINEEGKIIKTVVGARHWLWEDIKALLK